MINYEQRFKINVFAYFEQFEGVSRVKVFVPALVHVRASFPIAGNISNSIHSHFHVKQAFQFQLYGTVARTEVVFGGNVFLKFCYGGSFIIETANKDLE